MQRRKFLQTAAIPAAVMMTGSPVFCAMTEESPLSENTLRDEFLTKIDQLLHGKFAGQIDEYRDAIREILLIVAEYPGAPLGMPYQSTISSRASMAATATAAPPQLEIFSVPGPWGIPLLTLQFHGGEVRKIAWSDRPYPFYSIALDSDRPLFEAMLKWKVDMESRPSKTMDYDTTDSKTAVAKTASRRSRFWRALGRLTTLRSLSIGEILPLTTDDFPEMARLERLEQLTITEQNSRVIPTYTADDFSRLAGLPLRALSIVDPVPSHCLPGIARIRSLESLQLGQWRTLRTLGSTTTAEDVTALGKLKSLRGLTISVNAPAGSNTAIRLADFPALETCELRLALNRNTEENVSEDEPSGAAEPGKRFSLTLADCPELTMLNISGLETLRLEGLSKMKTFAAHETQRLEVVQLESLKNFRIGGAESAMFDGVPLLERVDFGSSPAYDVVAALAAQPAFRTIGNTADYRPGPEPQDSDFLVPLAGHPRFDSLSLMNQRVDRMFTERVAAIPNLKYLCVFGNVATAEDVAEPITGCQKLTAFRFYPDEASRMALDGAVITIADLPELFQIMFCGRPEWRPDTRFRLKNLPKFKNEYFYDGAPPLTEDSDRRFLEK